jgi:hypothetical protein
MAGASVAALALAASATSLANGFACDDLPIIVRNQRVHQLLPPWQYLTQTYWPPEVGAALYRPITILGFALEWALGRGAPWVFHTLNVGLYLVAAVLVLLLAQRLVSPAAAWLMAAWFAVHPVHVEVVANGVGQPEIVVAVLHLTAVLLYLRARKSGTLSPGLIAGLGTLYLASCLAKEHGIILPGLLLAAELTVVRREEPWSRRLRSLGTLFAALTGVALGFLAGRATVLGGVAGDFVHPALRDASFGERVVIMLAVVPQWLRLLLVPWHLQADYMPRELDSATRLGGAQALGALIVIALGLIAWRSRRRFPVTTFGILWVAVALLPVSNLVVPTGILLAERTLFLPSMGVALAIGGLEPWLADRVAAAASWERWIAAGSTAALLLLWTWRSAERAPVWRNDEVFYRQTVLDAPLSYRVHEAYGILLFNSGKPADGERELRTALRLYPEDPYLYLTLGDRYQQAGLCPAAIPLFREAIRLEPTNSLARNKLIHCLEETGDQAAAEEEIAEKFRRGEPDAPLIRAAVDSLRAHASNARR